MSESYRFDPSGSRFTAQALATGMLSAFAHNPNFAVRAFRGGMLFGEGGINGLAIDLTIDARSLELVDMVSPSDHREIEERMHRDVLETVAYPEIHFQAEDVPAELIDRGEYRLRIGGRLTLHGVIQPRQIEAELHLYPDGIRLGGAASLRLSDYRIRPVTALGGTIKLKDEMHLAFDLLALPEGS